MDYKQSIETKIKHAKEIEPRAMQCCLDYIVTNDNQHLTELGSYLGTFANNLRSALNYTIADYCQQRDFQKTKKGKKLSNDFPYAYSKKDFQKLELPILMSGTDHELFSLVEKSQPYYMSQMWLGHLMQLSNIDKHKISVEVQNDNISAMALISGQEPPRHFGSTVLIVGPNKQPILIPTPCYINPLFALPSGKWITFSVSLENRTGTFVPAYIERTPALVEALIAEIYKWI